jgi:hypothetical protein
VAGAPGRRHGLPARGVWGRAAQTSGSAIALGATRTAPRSSRGVDPTASGPIRSSGPAPRQLGIATHTPLVSRPDASSARRASSI